jgi:hypothetical protein
MNALAAIFCKKIIDLKIHAGGFAFKKPVLGCVLFYAGPDEAIVKIVRLNRNDPSFSPIPNWKLASNEATRLHANRLDDTPLFSYLRSTDFIKDAVKIVGRRFAALIEKPVWDYVSDKFSRTTPFKEAVTLACGAHEKSSFRAKELFGMLDNPHLEIVNKRDAAMFRDFRKLGAKEVFALSCATYLLDLRTHARASNDNEVKALYKNERDFFLAWRNGEKAAFRAKSKTARLAFKKARKEILTKHAASATRPLSPSVPHPLGRDALHL